MPTRDHQPLTDTQACDRLQQAQDALGDAPGLSIPGNTALEAARKVLKLLTLGLIAAGERRDQLSDPPAPSPSPSAQPPLH